MPSLNHIIALIDGKYQQITKKNLQFFLLQNKILYLLAITISNYLNLI